MNSFSGAPSPILYNLSTKKAATPKITQHFLLGAMQIERRAMNDCIHRYVENEHAFQQPIKKQAVSTFADEKIKISRRINGKIKELNGM